MRSTFSISLPRELARELDRLAGEEGISRSEAIRESLRDYLFIRHFRKLRRNAMKRAQARGLYVDQDVFDRIS